MAYQKNHGHIQQQQDQGACCQRKEVFDQHEQSRPLAAIYQNSHRCECDQWHERYNHLHNLEEKGVYLAYNFTYPVDFIAKDTHPKAADDCCENNLKHIPIKYRLNHILGDNSHQN